MMPLSENVGIQNERRRLREQVDLGLVAGFDSNINQPPPFAWDRPWSMLTIYQRAYLVGREIQAWERDDAETSGRESGGDGAATAPMRAACG